MGIPPFFKGSVREDLPCRPVCLFQPFVEPFSQLESAVDFAVQLFPVLDILHFTGDGSGMSICKSFYWSLVGI